ncbi:MAG: tyrosine-type recombinase/integrase [Bdellovibrionales bacterium]|nr:tyrosine-type recombinase/integrase [Bdellovibrionales bacterium]
MLLYEEEFLSDLQFSKNYSYNTLSAYKRDLNYYKEFCNHSHKKIKEFYIFLDKKKLSIRTQARVISCLRSYFKFLQQKGETCFEMNHLKLPKPSHKLPKVLQIKDFQALWKVCEEKNVSMSLRNQLVLSFLYGLGCRVSELIALNVKDVNQMEAWISVLGKGNKQRHLPLSKNLSQFLGVYLEKSRPYLGNPEKNCLFFNNRGNRPSRIDIWRWLKNWSLKAGLNDIKNPHSFRHGCATELLDKGANLRSIQKLLGHSNLQTTQIYTSVSTKKLKSAVEKYHPLSKIKNKNYIFETTK